MQTQASKGTELGSCSSSATPRITEDLGLQLLSRHQEATTAVVGSRNLPPRLQSTKEAASGPYCAYSTHERKIKVSCITPSPSPELGSRYKCHKRASHWPNLNGFFSCMGAWEMKVLFCFNFLVFPIQESMLIGG